jgi:hypothetical protein
LSCYRRVADDRTVLDRAASVVGFYFVDASATCKQAILRGSGPTWVETLISLADRARKAAAMSEQKFEDQVQLAKGGADKEVKSPGRQTTQWIYRRRGAGERRTTPSTQVYRVAKRPTSATLADRARQGRFPVRCWKPRLLGRGAVILRLICAPLYPWQPCGRGSAAQDPDCPA